MSDQTKPMLPGLPEPDIRVSAFGEVLPTDRRPFVMGDFYNPEQVRAIQLATWKAATESAARRCEWLARLLSGPHESDGEYAVYMGAAAAIRQAPEPGEGG